MNIPRFTRTQSDAFFANLYFLQFSRNLVIYTSSDQDELHDYFMWTLEEDSIFMRKLEFQSCVWTNSWIISMLINQAFFEPFEKNLQDEKLKTQKNNSELGQKK